MTFRELELYLRGALEHEARMVMTGAWFAASWQRSVKMPSLKQALGRLAGPQPSPKNWQAQLAYVRDVLIPQFGGQLQSEGPA